MTFKKTKESQVIELPYVIISTEGCFLVEVEGGRLRVRKIDRTIWKMWEN